ncbi:hypothetical protein [Labilithrix luteola]|nr:hypothetical protein [Labilithrix luteola]
MLARLLGACAAFSMLALSTIASGEESRRALVSLEWTRAPGAETCLSEAELVEDVEVTLHRRPFAPRNAADRLLRASIARSESGTGWTARTSLSTSRGEPLGARDITIAGESCEEASEAIVLAISLMVELPFTTVELEERRRVEEAARWHLQGRLGPAVVVEQTMSAAAGANFGLVLTPARAWPVALDLLASLRSGVNPESSRYWFASTMIGLSVCPLSANWSNLHLAACAGPEITTFTGWGGGFARNRLGLSSTFGAWVRSDVTYELAHRLRLFGSLGIVATPQRFELTFADDQGVDRSLHRTSFVSATFALGLAVELF